MLLSGIHASEGESREQWHGLPIRLARLRRFAAGKAPAFGSDAAAFNLEH